ncbi:MAG: GspE/PulE family protein [Patescibacteria group bacterium]
MNDKTIALVLKDKGLISEQQAKEVDLLHLETGKSQEEILGSKKIASREDILMAKADVFGVPFVNLDKVGFSPVSVSYIPRGVAEKYHLIPFNLDQKGQRLFVAMANPLDVETIEFLEKKTEMGIIAHMALPEQIDKTIKERYEQELTTQVKEALKESDKKKKLPDLDHLEEVIREAPIAKIVATILQFAMRSRASDVHIEPREESTRVRYRVDGILLEKLLLPKKVHEAVISRIKILADMKIDERRVPQDGRFTFTADGEQVDLRVSTAPTVYGEKVVMRLLKKQSKIPTLQELGLRGKALRDLQIAVEKPHGMLIVCGPTGSGKTSTLYSVLTKLSTTKVNIMTIEDPVEYQIEGINQVQVNPQAGLTFSSALRSFLRQDPDIIMVGEIRDEETTELSIHAALTGHLVFSTLHTNDAAGAPPRLMDMGAESFLLVSSLNCVLAQRVLRRICTACKEEHNPPPEAIEDVKKVLGDFFQPGFEAQKKITKKEELTFWRGKGCPECNNTGYLGRIGIFEVMPISDAIVKLILNKAASGDVEKQAREEGMMTMVQDGYLKVLEGITTVEEVLRVAQN